MGTASAGDADDRSLSDEYFDYHDTDLR